MPRTFVALDLETTGLEARRDAIIEVAAVKFRDGEPVDQFATLVDPGRPIPYEITVLTGITDRDVIGKPRFAQVAEHLTRFVGDLPVVGHNIGFDLGFLDVQGALASNKAFDTWELATILLPSLPSYGLAALATQFGLETANAHRALADAQMTGQLFLRLSAEVARLPRPVLLEINRLAQGSDWPLAQIFAEGLMAAGVVRLPRQEIPLEELAPQCPLFQPWRSPEPLNPRESPQPIEVEELAAMLKPGGALSQAFPGYEYRPPQVAMLRAVAEAFNQSHHLMVEAGTGTGKSLAYLLPAIAYAVKNNARVVVSTNTINLQDQLFNKDLPDLQRVLREAWGREIPFRAALLKGRGNYLCPRRFLALKSRTSLSADELRGIARILVWLPRTQTGDQSELSLPRPSDRAFWAQVSADNEGCTLDRCQREMKGRCFFYRARKQAEAAHIVVVNHALLMADAATDNRVLPEYHHLIIDEAHHLEDAVTDQLSFKADAYTLSQLFATLYSSGAPAETRRGRRPVPARAVTSTGLLAEILAWAHTRAPAEHAQALHNLIYGLQADVAAVSVRLQDFWQVLEEALRDMTPPSDNDEYGLRLRITPAIRNQPIWVDVEVSWENLAATWQALLQHLEPLGQLLRDLLGVVEKPEVLESMAEELGTTILRLLAFYEQMEAWVMQPDANSVYWVEASGSDRQAQRLTLRAAPLHIGPLVQQHIFFRNDTVVMTSATLRTGGSFDYLRGRLCADEADTATVGSPFDYKTSTLLYLPTDLPEPTEPGYQKAVEQALIGLARALGGRTLALFTSHSQLRHTARAIAPVLAEAGITVLSQSSGTSRHQLLEAFKTTDRTILLGTRSFWEGVDVVGPALSALVLVRLPFAVPSDPIVAARAETFDDPFYNYSVPDAILRFRQGFGRLIRSKSDRGVVVVLDRRVQSKTYGQLFLDSLPECTVYRGPLVNLPTVAQRWLEAGSGGFDSAESTRYDARVTSEAFRSRRF